MSTDVEASHTLQLNFNKVVLIDYKVIPVAVQDIDTLEVLTIAYVNKEALELALDTQKVVFYSTSRQEIWIKGDVSGSTFTLIEVLVNCEQNSLLYRVRQDNAGMCHTKDIHNNYRVSCFYRKLDGIEHLQFIDKK